MAAHRCPTPGSRPGNSNSAPPATPAKSRVCLPRLHADDPKELDARATLHVSHCNFKGECEGFEEVPRSRLANCIVSTSQLKVKFGSRPRTALFIKKFHDQDASLVMREMVDWLTEQGVKVLVEESVRDAEFPELSAFDPKDPGRDVDFCVCLGGDGTLLHLNSIFQQDRDLEPAKCGVPPLLSFAYGTLGFLTAMSHVEYKNHLGMVLQAHEDPLHITLRIRLHCRVFRGEDPDTPVFQYQVLNELLLGRGHGPYLSQLDLSVNGYFVTSAAADGLIVSTPTGSTAYSMSAGGSMVSPSVPAILVTPICPHTLSFRPLVLPDSSHIRVSVPVDSRHTAWASFDGRHQLELVQGDFIEIAVSEDPVPCMTTAPFDEEWFLAIKTTLNWNRRTSQRSASRRQRAARQNQENQQQQNPDHGESRPRGESNSSDSSLTSCDEP